MWCCDSYCSTEFLLQVAATVKLEVALASESRVQPPSSEVGDGVQPVLVSALPLMLFDSQDLLDVLRVC